MKPICNKKQLTKAEVDFILKRKAKGMGKQFRNEKRAYYCEHCKAWHLTHTEMRKAVEPVATHFKNNWLQLLDK